MNDLVDRQVGKKFKCMFDKPKEHCKLLANLQAENKRLKEIGQKLCNAWDCLYNGIDTNWAKTEIGKKMIKMGFDTIEKFEQEETK